MKLFITVLLSIMLLSGCAASPEVPEPVEQPAAEPYDGSDYIQESSFVIDYDDLDEIAHDTEVIKNYDSVLSVPTYLTKVDDTYFIVDCYHNRIIYSKELGLPLDQWNIMTQNVTRPHTLASDGTVYLVDDTDNDRVLVFEKVDDKFIQTQVFLNVGDRPHYAVYDEPTDTFYVWSSVTGELYCYRREASSTRMYLTDKRSIPELNGIYVRSFSIIDGDIFFVSGVSEDSGSTSSSYSPCILCCDLNTLQVKKRYSVPNSIAGMVQLTKIQDYYYVTVSTDKSGNQDVATILQSRSLDDLSAGKYNDIYSKHFIGGGTPYYMTCIDDTFYLTEHRLKGHSIWSFRVDNGSITDVTALY